MFKEMRRKDRQIFGSEIEEILNIGQFGVLSTISDNGYPYVVPLNYVYYNNCIYFHSAADGHKLQNIKKNNKVSFCVVTNAKILPDKFSTKYNSVIAFGIASEVPNDMKEDILFKLMNKYSKGFLDMGKEYIQSAISYTKVIRIEIKHITGKARK